jgi:hypothetical protein
MKDLWGKHCIVDDGQIRNLGVCVGGFDKVWVFKKDGTDEYFTTVGATITIVP